MNYRSIVEAANTEWNKALNSGNITGLAALYSENAILSPENGQTLIGRAEIETLFKSFVDGGVHNHTLEIVEVGGSDNMIFQVAKWNAKGAEINGEKPSFGGIMTSVFELAAEGNWLVRAHIWNANK